MASRKKNTPIEKEIPENIIHSAMDELMGDRFGVYAKDVIQDRAIPEARDGMKPVQRRIIYAMYKTGNTIEKPTKKCAHIVGEVMGKYHPHGDSSIYEALVHMSQSWKIRYPLIDFQGNNGSMDGDGPAAYRYTEARLSALSEELIRDIDKETVDMELTFDDVEFEPSVLPARFPNLYVNGSQGIAVGMATEIPPHNLKEVSSAIIYRLKHPNCDLAKLVEFVPGPDFPTGGIIYKSKGLESIYRTGRGKIEISSKVEIVDGEDGKQIIVSEIPYGVVKSALVGEIDRIRHDKIIPGIEEVRDETDKNGLRIAIDLKAESNPTAILTYLLGKTALRTSYSANIVAIVDGKPKTLDLLTYCDAYINHQIDVVTRSSNFDLKKDKERLLIVEGLLKAASIINEIIAIIRKSKDKADSKINLEAAFGFLPQQSEAIVMMPLHKLSNTDVVTLENEKEALMSQIAWLEKILGDRDTLLGVIEKDLKEIVKKYGNDRRSQIVDDDGSLRTVNKIDLIEDEDVYVAATRDGYLKRSSISSYKGSGGARGVNAGMKDGDTMVFQALTNTKDTMLFFTNKGNYLYVPVHLLKVTKWLEEGVHVNYAINLPPEEKIIRGYAVKAFRDDLFIIILTKHGQIKRTRLSDFPVARINRPIKAMKIIESDSIVDVRLSSGGSNLFVLSEDGKGVYYNENELSVTSTSSSGVKAGKFHGSDCAKVLSFYPEEKGKVLLLTRLGHTRVFDTRYIELGNRLSSSMDIFRSFKQEPHQLVYMEKAAEKEFPYSVKTTLTNGDYLDINFPDSYLTPLERYAKKPDDLNLTKKNPIAFINNFFGEVIDDKILSLPVVEKEKEVPTEEVSIEEECEEKKEEGKFEQISLFDDVGE